MSYETTLGKSRGKSYEKKLEHIHIHIHIYTLAYIRITYL
jgi:hypothetical protein